MKKRLLAVLLCMMMVMVLLPGMAFAENAPSVWICGQELTSTYPYYHNGANGTPGTADNDATNYNAYFDANAGKLTLKGLSVVDSSETKDMQLGGATFSANYVVYALGDLTICLDGDNSVSVGSVTKAEADANSLALYVTGALTVQPGVTGSGSLTAESKGATSGTGTVYCNGVVCKTLEVKSGADIIGKVSGSSKASAVFNAGVNLDAVTVTGGTLKGIVSEEAVCEITASATSCGIMVNNGVLSLSDGSIEATGGSVEGSEGTSLGVAMGNETGSIRITGGSFTANSGTATNMVAVQKSLSLGSGITAKGSTSSNGSNPVNYEAANNDSYMWVQAQEIIPALTVTASPSGSVAMDTAVTLTATPANIEGTPSYQWFSNTQKSREGAIKIKGAIASTYAPLTDTPGTIYYYCVVPDVAESNIVGVTVKQPVSSDDHNDDYTPSSVTVYNDPSVPNATVWLTGNGLDSNDLLIVERDTKGSAYEAMSQLADSGDVFDIYNIYLRSGMKSTSSAMNLTFDLNAKYAGDDFTLVHQKADSTYEYFYDTAGANGDLSFGPLYELSPFMLVKGRLEANSVDNPQTADSLQTSLWLGTALFACAGLVLGHRKCQRD